MAKPTSDEIQEAFKEETEYKTPDDILPEAYYEAVTSGNK